jgi:putative NADH-flavin reductase
MAGSKIFVVGATGATGKYVVQLLLDKGESVVAVARSKEKLLNLLAKQQPNGEEQQDYGTRLQIHEASVLDLTDPELSTYMEDCRAVVSCLGHSMTLSGIYGAPRKLVTEATRRLTTAMPPSAKFILMGSEGFTHELIDPVPRPGDQRFLLWLIRHTVPPHADMEQASEYLVQQDRATLDWSVVRPTNLIDEPEASGEYSIVDHPDGDLIGNDVVSRANVAHFMVELITNPKTWETYRHKMPVMKPKDWKNSK